MNVFLLAQDRRKRHITVLTEFAQTNALKYRLNSFKHQPSSSWPEIGCPMQKFLTRIKTEIVFNLSEYTLHNITVPFKYLGCQRRRGMKCLLLLVSLRQRRYILFVLRDLCFKGQRRRVALLSISSYYIGWQRWVIWEWAADWRGCPSHRKWTWLKATGFLFKDRVLGHFTVWDTNSQSSSCGK